MNIFEEEYKHVVPPAIIFAVVVLLFGGMVFNGFVYDDQALLTNKIIKDDINPISYFADPGTLRPEVPVSLIDVYRPLSTWFFSLQSHFFGVDSFYFHLISLFLHAINCVLFFFLFDKIIKNPAMAFLGALIFGTHPITVETVAWAFQQSGLWAWFFSFITFLILVFEDAAIPKKFLRVALVLLLSFAAVFTKEHAVILPFIYILYILCFGLEIKKRWPEIAAIVFPAIVYIVARLILLDSFSQVEAWLGSRFVVFCTMIPGLFYYFKLMVWPYPLSLSYDSFPIFKTLADPAVSASAIFPLLLALTAIILRRKRPLFSFGIFWIFAVFLPVSNVVFPTKQILAERFAYFMLPGLIFAIFDLALFVKEKWMKEKRFIPVVFFAAAAVLIIFSNITFARLGDWKDEFTLWGQQIKITPDEWRTQENYGFALEIKNKSEEAVAHYGYGWYLYSGPVTAKNLAGVYYRIGEMKKAEDFLSQIVIDLFPEDRKFPVLLGLVYLSEKKYEMAAGVFESLLSKNPKNDGDIFYAALSHKLSGEKEEKVVAQIEQIQDENFRKLAPILIESREKMLDGKWPEAVSLLYNGLNSYPSPFPEFYLWLAESFEEIEEKGRAIAIYDLILRNNPLSIEAIQGLARNGAE